MKKFLIGALTLTILGGSTLVANAQANQGISKESRQALEYTREISLQEVKESLQDLIGKSESEEITKEDLEVVNEKLSIATESWLPKVGDGVEEVCNYIELQKANAEMEEFQKYLDTIDTTKYQPISQEELEQLLND